MTRKKDCFWEYAERLNGRFKCKFCERDFAGGAFRVKSHLSAIKGRDIEICTKVPRDIQLAAASTINGVHKRPKTEAFSSNSDETSSEICEKDDSSVLDNLLAKLVVLNNIDVKSPIFVDFVNAIAAYGPGYNLPSDSRLETVLIPSLLEEVRVDISNVKESWGETGCTLVSDVWYDDTEDRSFLNIMACSPKGLVLLHSLEIPKHNLNSGFLEVIVSFAIQTIGARNVVQYINGAQGVGPIGSLIANDYPHIYVSRCVVLEIRSLFEEVYNEVEWVQLVFRNAKCLATRIYGHSNLLSHLRKYTNNIELGQLQRGEFFSSYSMLLSLIEVKDILVQLVASPEWLSFDYDIQELGKEIIHSSEVWDQAEEIVSALGPLWDVVYLVDRYCSSSGYLYEAMKIATENIRKRKDSDPTKYQMFWEIFESRKDLIVHPIHQVAAFLNPSCVGLFEDKAKVIEVMAFMERNFTDDEDRQAFVEQMLDYHRRKPELFSNIAKIMLTTSHPCEWWGYWGHKLPLLKNHAIRILSQPCSSFACKQGLSAFTIARIKQRQRCTPEAPFDYSSLKMNMILTAKSSARYTTDKPIDLTELGKLRLGDRSFSNDLLNGATIPCLRYATPKYASLQFVTKIACLQVTGQEIRGEHGSVIHVFLVDPVTGVVVQDERLSTLELTVSVLEGDFDEPAINEWTKNDFKENKITDATLVTDHLRLTLKKGMGTLGSVTFHSDSSSTRNGKFKLGVETAIWNDEEVHIREGLSNAFVVEKCEDTRMHINVAANQTQLPDDSWPEFNLDDVLPFQFSPLQNIASGGAVSHSQYYDPVLGNAGAMYKHKQKDDDVEPRQARARWRKLKAVMQWGILRRIVARKRAQRMVVLSQVHKRLEGWAEGAKPWKEKPKPIKPASSTVGDQSGQSLTLFPSLLNEHRDETVEKDRDIFSLMRSGSRRKPRSKSASGRKPHSKSGGSRGARASDEDAWDWDEYEIVGAGSSGDNMPPHQDLVNTGTTSRTLKGRSMSRLRSVDVNRASQNTLSRLCGNSAQSQRFSINNNFKSFADPMVVEQEDGDSAVMDDNSTDDPSARTLKSPRLIWTPQLHKRFVDAVAHLGIKNSVPKTIMQLMSVEGLTRENVASHLHKYRLYLERVQGLSSEGPSSWDRLRASSYFPQSLHENGGAMPVYGMAHLGLMGKRVGNRHGFESNPYMMQQRDWSGSVMSYPQSTTPNDK